MNEQELFNEYRKSNCKSFSDFLINKIAELEKENQKWKDEWQEQVQKATDEGYARTLQTIQLTKVKEIIRNLLSAYTTYADSFDDRDNEIVDVAEQFLNSEGK